jgi:hypothetical protein
VHHVLEQAGLVVTEKVERVRTCRSGLRGRSEDVAWIERCRQRWTRAWMSCGEGRSSVDAGSGRETTPLRNRTTVGRRSERERVVTRAFDGPARVVSEAWTRPELRRRWWVPRSTGTTPRAFEADVRAGGRYRLELGREGSEPKVSFGRDLEVTPRSRLAWTN